MKFELINYECRNSFEWIIIHHILSQKKGFYSSINFICFLKWPLYFAIKFFFLVSPISPISTNKIPIMSFKSLSLKKKFSFYSKILKAIFSLSLLFLAEMTFLCFNNSAEILLSFMSSSFWLFIYWLAKTLFESLHALLIAFFPGFWFVYFVAVYFGLS